MNNTINAMDNISFNARYLRLTSKTAEFPQKISDAIYKNDAIDEFLKAGQPKTFWEKLKDLFRKDEFLNIFYETKNNSSIDTYAKSESITFSFRDKRYPLRASQEGIKRNFGSIPKKGGNLYYKAPTETSTDKLVKLIEELENLDKLLK